MYFYFLLVNLLLADHPILTDEWGIITKGAEIKKIDLSDYSDYKGNLYVVRINPAHIKPEIHMADQLKEKPLSAGDWCRKYNLNIAINLGMYHKDLKTHVGYAKNGDYENNARWNSYRSALLINPKEAGTPYFYIADLDNQQEKVLTKKYNTVIQELRLIKGNGINVWQKKEERWPIASIATDRSGNLLLLFTETAISVYDFIQIILNTNLDIIKAAYLDGGSPASLSIHFKTINMNLSGNSPLQKQEPIPNIIGFRFQER